MGKNRRKTWFFMVVMTSILFFFCNVSKVHAAFDSEIQIPLYGSGITGTLGGTGRFKLSFSKANMPSLGQMGSPGTLRYVPGVSDEVFHTRWAGYKYIRLEVRREGKVIYEISIDGGDKQSLVQSKMAGWSVKDKDIVHFFFDEPAKLGITNYGGTSIPGSTADSKNSFQKDMYFVLSYDGFIPINNAISHPMFQNLGGNGGISATQVSSFLTQGKGVTNLGYSGDLNFDYFNDGKISPGLKFHTSWANYDYLGLYHYKITDTHRLELGNAAFAQGQTTFGDFGKQSGKVPVENGNIYKIFAAEPSKVRIWRTGVESQLKERNKKETYFELTQAQGLVELDFHRVQGKDTTLELGTNPETLKMDDFTNIPVSSYSSLSASFENPVKTDTVGTYDQTILIKQNLITSSDYLESPTISKVTIVDTTPPTATGKENVEIPIYGSLPNNPGELLENLKDNSGTDNLKIEYVGSIDTSLPGGKQVKIKITDASNNSTTITVNVTILPGTLTIKTIPTLNFGKRKVGDTIQSMNQNEESNVALSIDDLRGTGAGWTLQASLSDFTTQDGSTMTPQISLLNGVVSSITNNIEGLNTFDIRLNNQLQTIMQARQGSGIKNSVATFKNEDVSLINVSPSAKIGSYEATIDWVLLDTP